MPEDDDRAASITQEIQTFANLYHHLINLSQITNQDARLKVSIGNMLKARSDLLASAFNASRLNSEGLQDPKD